MKICWFEYIWVVYLSVVCLILWYNHPEITALKTNAQATSSGMGKSLATSLPNLTMAAFKKPKNVARVNRQDICMGKRSCLLQRSFCVWSRFTFNEMRGGPQGRPPGVPSILGTSKTLQEGKRHNKAYLPQTREKWNLPCPHHPCFAKNPSHFSLCFGDKNITLGLRKASLLDTTRLCRDRGTVPITKNTTKRILAILSIAFGRHEEFLGIIHSVPQLMVPNPQLLDLGSQSGSHPGIPIIPQKIILSKKQYSPYVHQSEQSLCYNFVSYFTNMAKKSLEINMGWYHLFTNPDYCTIHRSHHATGLPMKQKRWGIFCRLGLLVLIGSSKALRTARLLRSVAVVLYFFRYKDVKQFKLQSW